MALLRPSELARLWELNPKTVYAWIREGKLPAIRTPGAQYRVRTDDARHYAEKNDLPSLPLAVTSPGGTITALGKPGALLRALAKICKSRGTALTMWSSTLEGLLAIAAEVPDVVAIDARCDEVKVADAVRALKRTKRTADVPIVVYHATSKGLGKLSANALVRGDDDEAAEAVVAVLEEARRK